MAHTPCTRPTSNTAASAPPNRSGSGRGVCGWRVRHRGLCHETVFSFSPPTVQPGDSYRPDTKIMSPVTAALPAHRPPQGSPSCPGLILLFSVSHLPKISPGPFARVTVFVLIQPDSCLSLMCAPHEKPPKSSPLFSHLCSPSHCQVSPPPGRDAGLLLHSRACCLSKVRTPVSACDPGAPGWARPSCWDQPPTP